MTEKEIKVFKILRQKKVNSFDDSLPICGREVAWDSGSALQHMEHLATSPSTGKINFPAFAKGFLWYDTNNPELVGSYKLPFCDVIAGKLTVVPKALIAVLGRLDQTSIPAEDKDKVRNVVAKYYKKMGMEMPA